MSGAGGGARRTTAQVFAAGQNERMHIARFASGPDPGLARAEVRASMVRDDKAVMRRARGGAPEPERPWLLTTTTTERTTPERTYVGSLEEAQCNKYVLLVPDGDSFKMIPCREWYTYVTRPSQIAKLKQGDSEEKQKEAEERMRMRNRKGDQYLERRMVSRDRVRAGACACELTCGVRPGLPRATRCAGLAGDGRCGRRGGWGEEAAHHRRWRR